MKRILLILLVGVFTQKSRSQADFLHFSPPTEAEYALQQCAFDSDADAVIFFDMASVNYDADYKMITERKVKMKILKESGIHLADIHIPYYSDHNFETIYEIDAYVWNKDANGQDLNSRLDRKLIYKNKINSLYSETTFALPDVKVGSIIEYHYKSAMENYGGLNRWEFQDELPVCYSSLNLVLLPNTEFAYSVFKNQSRKIDISPNKELGSIGFSMRNIPGLRQEAYMDARNDYLQRVEFQFAGYNTRTSLGYTTDVNKVKFTNTWKDLNRELWISGDYGGQLKTKPDEAKPLLEEWGEMKDPYQKMKAIHQYVRQSFNWNQIWSFETTESLRKTWDKKSGSSTDINLVLINLLLQAGMDAKPMLVSERSHGRVDTANVLKAQFNKTVALVNIGKDFYVLDASERSTPSSMIPLSLLNTYGFVLDKKSPSFMLIADPNHNHRSLLHINGEISYQGNLLAGASMIYYDYAKVETLKNNDLNANLYFEKLVDECTPLVTTDSMHISGGEMDTIPLQCSMHINQQLAKTGDYFLLNTNQLTDLGKNPFVKDFRFSDINFGSRYSCYISQSFKIDKGLVPEDLPANTRLVSEDRSLSITREMSFQDGKLDILYRIEFQRSHYSSYEYEMLKAFYKKMYDLLNEPVVLKTKAI